MFCVVHVPQFKLQTALRHEPELWARPVALVDATLTTPRVVDATTAARLAGVAEGLTAPQALARCRDVSIRHRSRSQEAAVMEVILQCAFGFSPHLEATSAGTVTLDLRGLTEFGPSEAGKSARSWAARLRDVLAALNLRVRVGMGATPNVARHAAHWAGEAGVPSETTDAGGIFVVSEATTFVAALPVAALEPSSEVADLLRRWGIRTVGEFLALGQADLADRLGLEALGLFAAASVTAVRPLHLVQPCERFEESHEFEEAIETLEPLLFLLRRLVDALGQRLELAGFAAGSLALRLDLEEGRRLERTLHVPQPTRRADTLFRMLHTHLETVRTESPVKAVRLIAEPHRVEQRQFSLFEAVLRDPQQFQETLARLAALVGADRVGSPRREDSHRPDAFILMPPDFENVRIHEGTSSSESWRPIPLRRLRPEVPAQVETKAGTQRPTITDSSDRVVGDTAVWREASLDPARRPENIIAWLRPLLRPAEGRDEPKRKVMKPAPEGDPGATSGPSDRPSTREDRVRLPEGEGLSGAASPPVTVRCAMAHGRVTQAVGPWRLSGHWWEAGGWERDEWEVALAGGVVLRLAQSPTGWVVVGILD